jgi:uncharacterized protein (DUF488 family)
MNISQKIIKFKRKLSTFWYKTILRKLGLFKRYKQPKIDEEFTLLYLAKYNSSIFTDEQKAALNKKHGRHIKISNQEFWDRVNKQLEDNLSEKEENKNG